MLDFYIHQIGDIRDLETYDRLKSILSSRAIYSRKKLEEFGIVHNYKNSSFKLDIPSGKEDMYYTDDIHKGRVSLSDPNNRFIKRAIESRDHINITCFDYDYIALAVSRDIQIVPFSETCGLALGEVQVQDLVSENYISGIILPFSTNDLLDDKVLKFLDKITSICNYYNMPLDIYNYKGDILKEKSNKKTK